MKPRAAWFIPVPLAVASWMGAHCFAYWLVAPGGEEHMGMHAEGSHAYLGYTPALVLWGLALLAAGLVFSVGEGLRGRRPSPPPVRLFVLLPPIGFAVQEPLERLMGTGQVPVDIVLEPTFILGLGLQLPFAVVALLLAHALGAIGFGAGRALAHRGVIARRMVGVSARPVRPSADALAAPPSVLARAHGPRAPPAFAC
jgi:hypothetical protein